MLFKRKMFKYKFKPIYVRIVSLILIFISFVFIFNKVDNTIDGIIKEITIKNAEEIINTEVNKAVSKVTKNCNIDYLSFINTNSFSNQTINANYINKFKTQIILKTEKSLSKYKSLRTVVQLGSLSSSSILSNRGPDIPIYFDFYCTVNANVTNDFTEAGINQTKHSIKLVVLVDYCIIFNEGNYESQVTTDYVLSENVIVGTVPDYYGNLYGLSTEKED